MNNHNKFLMKKWMDLRPNKQEQNRQIKQMKSINSKMKTL